MSWLAIESGAGRLTLLAVLTVLSAVAAWWKIVRHADGYSLPMKLAATVGIGIVGGVVGYFVWAFVSQFFVGQ